MINLILIVLLGIVVLFIVGEIIEGRRKWGENPSIFKIKRNLI